MSEEKITTEIIEPIVSTIPIIEMNGFPALNKRFEFVSVDENDPSLIKVRCLWRDGYNGENFEGLCLLKAKSVEIEVLKKYEIWNQLSPAIQKELEDMTVEERRAVHNLMEKARGSRKEKYKNIPRFISCITCQAKIKIAPGALIKKVENIAAEKKIIYTIDDFLKQFQCNKCDPKPRGKKPNPEFANLPEFLVCACGKKVATNPYQLKKKAEKNHTTIQKLIEEFICQKCAKTFGVKGNGKCTPIVLKCKCGRTVTYPKNMVQKKADDKSVSVEKFISNYRCQKCFPTPKIRHKKSK